MSMMSNTSSSATRAVVLLIVALAATVHGSSTKTKSWTLWHRILAPSTDGLSTDWTVRGDVQLTLDSSSIDEPAKLEITNGADSLPLPLAHSLSTTAQGAVWYQVKLVHNGAQEVVASVPACNVRRANFRDEFVVQLQQGTALALSVTYMPLVSPLAPPSCADYTSLPDQELKFESRISFDTAIPGMIVGKPPPKEPIVTGPKGAASPHANALPPPGLKWIPGSSRKKSGPGGAGGAGFTPDPMEGGIMGFFKRYWYYIVPLMLIQIWGSQPPEPEGEAGAAPGTAAAAGTQPTGAASSTPTGTQAVRRRGKKE